jgi:hypothetical protein
VLCSFQLRRTGSAALFPPISTSTSSSSSTTISATSTSSTSGIRDRVVAVAYPAAYDRSNSRAHILGNNTTYNIYVYICML